jgi:MSHA biogenesis protein MshJ
VSPLRSKWVALGARFNAYSRRERGLLAGAAVGGILLFGFSVLIDPDLARARSLAKSAEQVRAELATIRIQSQAIKAQLQIDPDAARRAEIASLRGELDKVDASLKELEGRLVPPQQMNMLLERLLARHASLKLLSLKSLVPINLAQAVADEGKPAGSPKPAAVSEPAASLGPGLYKHGVELRLEGSYTELYDWIAQLEAAPQKVLWGDVRFAVVEHPRAVLTLTVYTLSLDKSWLAI